MARIGVFICWCGENIARTVDVAGGGRRGGRLPGVRCAVDYKYMCSDPGQALIREKIAAEHLDGVVVASCSPHMHLSTFRKAAAEAGLNPYLVEMANIREHCSWVHHDRRQATAKAIDLIRMAVAKVAAQPGPGADRVPVTRRALVIGGGVAGIQAALDIADAGYQVVLVEREPSIGGKMAGLSETFPTLDCSQCILTPRMVEVAQHPNIKLHTYSEVEAVDGFVGNFKVTIRKKARYVDIAKCTGCGQCWNACPSKKNPSDFDYGMGMRTAIYIPFPQAVPARPVIDTEACTQADARASAAVREEVPGRRHPLRRSGRAGHGESRRDRGGHRLQALQHRPEARRRQARRLRRIRLRPLQGRDRLAAVRAAGLGLRPHRRRDQAAFRRQDAQEAWSSSVAWARATTPRACSYCSKICCMYTAKHTMLYKHKVHDGQAHVFYMDIRAGGKNYDEFVRRAIEQDGAQYHRGRVSKITEENGKLIVRGADTLAGEPLTIEADLVVLAAAMRPADGVEELAQKLNVGYDEFGFLCESHPKLRPVETNAAGVFVCGACQGPKDIPESVAQASAAAGKVLVMFSHENLTREPEIARINENDLRGLLRLRAGLPLPRHRAGRDPRPQAASSSSGPRG